MDEIRKIKIPISEFPNIVAHRKKCLLLPIRGVKSGNIIELQEYDFINQTGTGRIVWTLVTHVQKIERNSIISIKKPIGVGLQMFDA